MANKGQVSEKDLESSIKSLGGLGGLSGGTRRDSPFGSDFAKRTQSGPAPAPPVSNVAPLAVSEAKPATEVKVSFETTPEMQVKTIELKSREIVVPEAVQSQPAAVVQMPRAMPVKKAQPAPVLESPVEKPVTRGPIREVDLTERVTFVTSSEMRDEVTAIATKLQRRKIGKTERITANTVMRVAVQFLIDELKLDAGDRPDTEGELLALMKRKLRGK